MRVDAEEERFSDAVSQLALGVKSECAGPFVTMDRPGEQAHVATAEKDENGHLVLDLANHSASKGIGVGYAIPDDVNVRPAPRAAHYLTHSV